MKNKFTGTFLVIMLAFSCSQEKKSEKEITLKENSERTERYVASDGNSALVTFTEKNGEKSIAISRENRTIAARQKRGETDTYADHDYEIAVRADSVIINQGNQVIGLKKARGQ